MLAYRYSKIAREGWGIIGLIGFCLVVVQAQYGIVMAIPVWGVFFLSLVIYRDPSRSIPPVPLGIVSPVNGCVVVVDTISDPYIDRPAKRVTIDVGLLDGYALRSPTEGKIVKQGSGLNGEVSDFSDNRQATNCLWHWIQTDETDDIILRMSPKSTVLRPKCYVSVGERVGQGQRCGFVHFGSMIEVLLPEASYIEVVVGDRVKAGSDLLARLYH